jgi:hypothetical protein
MVNMSKCADCGENFSNDTSLEGHKEKSAACRLKRATNRILEQIRANQPLPQGPVVEDAPLGDFDDGLPTLRSLRIMIPRRSRKIIMVPRSPMRRPQGSKILTLASRLRLL